MTNERLEQIKQIRAYGLQAEPTALLLAIDDLLAGAAVSASPQPRFLDWVRVKYPVLQNPILLNYGNQLCDPEMRGINCATIVEEYAAQFFAAAPAQEPQCDRCERNAADNQALAHISELLMGYREGSTADIIDRVKYLLTLEPEDEAAAQEQPVENSPQTYQKAIQELQIVKFVSDGDGDWIAVRKHGFDKLRALAEGKP